jgi:hypothetical protein
MSHDYPTMFFLYAIMWMYGEPEEDSSKVAIRELEVARRVLTSYREHLLAHFVNKGILVESEIARLK